MEGIQKDTRRSTQTYGGEVMDDDFEEWFQCRNEIHKLRAELTSIKQQRDVLVAALEKIGGTACGEASHQYIALTALAKVKK